MKNLALLSILSLTLTACGASRSGKSSTEYSSSAKTSICSVAENSSGLSLAKIRTVGLYGSSGYYNYVQVRLENWPSSFENDGGVVQFFQLTFNENGIEELSKAPLTFEIVDPLSPNGPVINPITGEAERNLTEVTYSKLASYGIDRVVLVVNVAGLNANLLDVVHFTQGGSEVSRSFGLLPPFVVDPAQYEASKSHLGTRAVQQIMDFHPFNNRRGMDESDYMDFADSNCLLGGLISN